MQEDRIDRAMQALCPACGCRYLEYLDGLGDVLDYLPCCETGRQVVEDSGFFDSLSHRQRKHLVQMALGVRCREVLAGHETWRLLWPLRIVPVGQKLAFELIRRHHRHHPPPPGWKFGFGVRSGQELVGVCVVGRPVSRRLQEQGGVLEVTRTCTWRWPQSRHAISMMLAEAARRARHLGCRRLITYTLIEEPGTSLIAAGWQCTGISKGGSWHRRGRARADKAPTGPKRIWQETLVPTQQHSTSITGGTRA